MGIRFLHRLGSHLDLCCEKTAIFIEWWKKAIISSLTWRTWCTLLKIYKIIMKSQAFCFNNFWWPFTLCIDMMEMTGKGEILSPNNIMSFFLHRTEHYQTPSTKSDYIPPFCMPFSWNILLIRLIFGGYLLSVCLKLWFDFNSNSVHSFSLWSVPLTKSTCMRFDKFCNSDRCFIVYSAVGTCLFRQRLADRKKPYPIFEFEPWSHEFQCKHSNHYTIEDSIWKMVIW